MAASSETQARFRPKDYLVGFFGSLVPGIMFIVMGIPAIVIPAVIAIRARMEMEGSPGSGLTWMSETGMLVLLSLTVLVFAYVIGYLFFRQDTKPVDRCSCLLYGEDDGPVKLCEELENARRQFRNLGFYPLRILAGWWLRCRAWLNVEWRTNLKQQVQYPYPNLESYLEDRGFRTLKRLVEHFRGFRSKHFINRLKIVINSIRPEMYHSIAQAEAHVRLSSSSWYVCNALIMISVGGMLIALLGGDGGARLEDPAVVISLALPLAVIITTMWIKRQIVKAFHYQRIREIIIVLQTFVTALAIEKELDGVADVSRRDLVLPNPAVDPEKSPGAESDGESEGGLLEGEAAT